MLPDSFQKSATYLNIRSSFEATGAVYDIIDQWVLLIMRFSIQFTTQIWHFPRTKEEKTREKRKGECQTENPLKLVDLNNLKEYWEKSKAPKALSKVPKIIDYKKLIEEKLQYRLLN